MSGSKIQLSKDELDLVKNSSWILTKNLVIEKLVEGLGELSEKMTEKIAGTELNFSEVISSGGPRISRGERYEGLPYLVLDYPRIFGKEDIFAIRSFFWWGKHCSITIHSKGKFLPQLVQGIQSNAEEFLAGDFFLSTSGNEWVHDLEALPHESVKSMGKEELARRVEAAEFIRLGKLISIDQWTLMENELFLGFISLIKTMRVR